MTSTAGIRHGTRRSVYGRTEKAAIKARNDLLRTLTVDDIEDAEAVLLGRLAASAVHVAHGMLHSALKEAKRRRLITADPMAEMASPKADEQLMDVLSEAEVERLAADTGRDAITVCG